MTELLCEEPFVDSDGVIWEYQSLAEWQASRPELEDGRLPCWVCGGPSEYGVAGRRYCERCCP